MQLALYELQIVQVAGLLRMYFKLANMAGRGQKQSMGQLNTLAIYPRNLLLVMKLTVSKFKVDIVIRFSGTRTRDSTKPPVTGSNLAKSAPRLALPPVRRAMHPPKTACLVANPQVSGSTRIVALYLGELQIMALALAAVLLRQQQPFSQSTTTSSGVAVVVVVFPTVVVTTWYAVRLGTSHLKASPVMTALAVLFHRKTFMKQSVFQNSFTPLPPSCSKLYSMILLLTSSPFGNMQMMVREIVTMATRMNITPPNSVLWHSSPSKFRLRVFPKRSNSPKISLWPTLVASFSILFIKSRSPEVSIMATFSDLDQESSSN